jgi:hypothetical protein
VQQLKTRSAGDSKSIMHHGRVSRRYPLKELVIFSCKGEDALLSAVTGFTENVSTTGIAFLTEAAVVVGSYISLNLHLRSVTNEGKTILLQAEGTVLRVEPAGRQNRIAAEIRFQFQDDLEEGFAVLNTIQWFVLPWFASRCKPNSGVWLTGRSYTEKPLSLTHNTIWIAYVAGCLERMPFSAEDDSERVRGKVVDRPRRSMIVIDLFSTLSETLSPNSKG